MKPTFGLEQSQTQRLSLTPDVRQAIMVLQMGAMELVGFLREEAEGNPLLEVTERLGEPLPEAPDGEDEGLGYPEDMRLPWSLRKDGSGSPLWYDPYPESQPSLREYLLTQLGFLRLTREERGVGELIIGNIDDNGYLSCPPEEIADSSRRPREMVQWILDLVQTFEPAGVAAKDLKECLGIQARMRGLTDLAQNVIANHLEDLGAGRYKRIAREEKVPLSLVLRARDAVLGLDPKPGAKFSSRGLTYIVPDVFVRQIGDDFITFFNDSAVPRVRWNPFYIELLKTGDDEARRYLTNQLRKARSLLHSIEERRKTILRVMNYVVMRQEVFFRNGPGHLAPLGLKDVASELRLHESTVSRSICGKYVDTLYGVFPCKMLFSSRVAGAGKDMSQHSVRKMIEEIVRLEDPETPLSDGDIARQLSLAGIQMARRTVAKYRDALGIPPSGRRRKL